MYSSTYRSDLIPLLDDLPAPDARPGPWVSIRHDIVEQAWLASARWRGSPPTPTSPRQRRIVTALLAISLLLAVGSLLAGFAVGLAG